MKESSANIQKKYAADRLAYQRGVEEQDKQIKYNNEAANKVYEQEQTKMTEAKKKAHSPNRLLWPRQLAQKVQFYLQAGPDSRLVC